MPPGPHALGRRAEQRRAGARAAARRASAGRAARRARRGPSTARRRARGRSRSAPAAARARRRGRRGRSSRRAGATFSSSSRARRLVHLDRDHLAGEHRRLAARARRRGRARARLRCEPTASPASCEPRLCGQIRPSASACLVDAVDARTRRECRSARPSISPRTSRTTVSGGSFCARISASASSSPRSRRQTSADPVGIRVLERPLRQRRRAARAIPSARRRRTAFVNGTARSSRARAHELDRLVHGRVARARRRGSRAGTRRAAARRSTGGSSLRTGRRPSVSIAWSSVRTRCTVP